MAQPKNFGFNEDEKALKDLARKFFQEKFSSNRLHTLVAANSDPEREPECCWDRALWQEIVDLGWLMTAIPERAGGLGMSAVAVTGLIEESGRAAFPSPLLATLSASYILAACNNSKADAALSQILDGNSFSLASCNEYGSWEYDDTDITVENGCLNGKSYFVQDAKKVDYFVVKASFNNEIGLYVIPADAKGLSIKADSIVDLTRDQAILTFDNVDLQADSEVATPGAGIAALQSATPAMLVLLSADMCGAAEWQLQTTTEYAKVRVQFDRPIGFYQAVKHPLVDFMVEIDKARGLLYNAACAIDHEPEMAEQYARMAKSVATDAVAYGSKKSVQLHGGIGFTWECYIHLYLKRQMHSQVMLGDAVYQRAKLAELILAA